MTLAKRTIDIPFVGALDESKSSHNLDPALFSKLENVQMSKTGELIRRPAFDEVSMATGYDARVKADSLFSYNNNLYAISNGSDGYEQGFYALKSKAAATSKIWERLGEFPEYINQRTPILRDMAYDQKDGDLAVGYWYDVYAYVSAQDDYLYVRRINKYSKEVVTTKFIESGRTAIRVIASPHNSGRYVLVLYRGSAYSSIFYKVFDTRTEGCPLVYSGTLVNGTHSTSSYAGYDVCQYRYNTDYAWVITYQTATGWTSSYLIETGSALWGHNVTMSNVIGNLANCELDGTVYVGFLKNVSSVYKVYYNGYYSNGTAVGSDVYCYDIPENDCNLAIICPETAGLHECLVCSTYYNSIISNWGSQFYITAKNENSRLILVSKLWAHENISSGERRIFGWFCDWYSNNYILCELVTSKSDRYSSFGAGFRPITTAAYGAAVHNRFNKTHNVSIGSNDAATVALPTLCNIPAGSDPQDPTEDYVIGFDKYSASRTSSDVYQVAKLDGRVFISGGLLMEFDGTQLFENGFIQDPWIKIVGSADGYVVPNAYTFNASYIFEWIDTAGVRHKSQPSIPAAKLGNGSQKYTRYYVPLTCTYRNPLNGVVIHSHFNTDWGGVTWYKAFATDYPPTVYNYTDGTTYTPGLKNTRDNFSKWRLLIKTFEAVKTYRQEIYSPPGFNGELPNHPVWGGCTHLVAHKQRLWAATAEDPCKLVYSKESSPNETISFYPADFAIMVPEPITGLASFGDHLLVFTRDSVYTVSGDGPDFRGQSGSFSLPQKLPIPNGCINWRSIVVLDTGVFFQSRTGLVALDRGFNLVPVGDPIKDSFTSSVSVIASLVIPSEKQARWLVSDNGTYKVFVFDWEVKDAPRWYVWTTVIPWLYGILHSGVFYGSTTDSKIVTEKAGILHDYNSVDNAKDASLTTGWITFDSMAEYKRLYKVALNIERLSTHIQKVRVYNLDDSSYQEKIFYDADIVTQATKNATNTRTLILLVVPMVNQKSRGYKIEVIATHNGSSTSNNLFKWVGLSLELGAKQGIRKQ
jgi:hypothetical protein